MDVRPFVIPHAQTAKLIEPGKRPLHDPPPPAQSTPVRGATHREPRHDVPRPQSAPNRRRVVAAIPEHIVRPPPRSSPSAMQWGNRIHQRQGFLRVVPVRAGQANRERHAPPVADQMTFAPALSSVTLPKVSGSVAVTPKSSDTTVRVRASEPVIPIATPTKIVRNP